MTPLSAYTPPRLSVLRQIIGGFLVLLLVVAFTLYALGVVRSDVVFLRHWFGNPVIGVVVVLALTIAVSFVLLPVRNEAVNHRRVLVRMLMVGLLAVSLIVLGFVQAVHVFNYAPQVAAHSADGRWTAIFVNRGDPDRRPLHLVVGSGLGERDVANFGAPCGNVVVVTFQGNQLNVHTEYGDFELPFNPVTGAPYKVIGARCSPTD